jgi:hypothetical protein
MKKIFIVLFILCLNVIKIYSQQNLIFKNDSIAIYDTYLSINTKDNIAPVVYKNGILYATANKSGFYKLFFSDFKNKPQKIKLNNKYHVGLVAVYKNEIYFTKNSNNSLNNTSNIAIYKGTLKNNKVTNTKLLEICKPDFIYAHPSIHKNGNTMVIVSNERGAFHLLELKRNELNKWVKSDVIYITQPGFKLLNPTIYNENTIYFSSNISPNVAVSEVEYGIKNGKPIVNNVHYNNTSSYNIYKITKNDGRWGIPEKVHVFSSEFDDLSVVFTSEKTGYISTFRYDNTDNIYYFELKY